MKVNKELYRLLEADNFQADYSKAEKNLGWKPRVKFEELVKIMVNYEINAYS